MTYRRLAARIAGAVLVVASLSACADESVAPNDDPTQVDSVAAPEVGACRSLTPADVAETSNAARTVDCGAKHNAQTYAVAELPEALAGDGRDSTAVGAYTYDECSTRLLAYVGADESLALRTVLTWAAFTPSQTAWDAGARWFRCDVVGGSELSDSLVNLPESAEGILRGRPDDRWMVCANGASVDASPKIPCSRPHVWRAVTTIKLGELADDYPGDDAVEAKTRDFCSDSVAAYLNYPVDYDFGFTWFHQTEWDAGNRRSICWAETSE